MPQARLKFSLPEEREEFEMAQRAGDLASTLTEIDRWLRGNLKYGLQAPWEDAPEDKKETVTGVLEEVRKKLWEVVNEHRVGDLL